MHSLYNQNQRFRELHLNRREARKILKEKLDELINGPLSKRQQKIAKVQKQKAKAKKRAIKKYGKKEDEVDEGEEGDGGAGTDKS
jgi:peptide chain release factor